MPIFAKIGAFFAKSQRRVLRFAGAELCTKRIIFSQRQRGKFTRGGTEALTAKL